MKDVNAIERKYMLTVLECTRHMGSLVVYVRTDVMGGVDGQVDAGVQY